MSTAPKLKSVKSAKKTPEIKMQDASLDIWDKKYRLKDKQEQPVDADINATYERVAKALSDVEAKDKRDEWKKRFVWALQHGAFPPAALSPMPVLRPTSQPPRPLTVPYPVLFQIPCRAFSSATSKPV